MEQRDSNIREYPAEHWIDYPLPKIGDCIIVVKGCAHHYERVVGAPPMDQKGKMRAVRGRASLPTPRERRAIPDRGIAGGPGVPSDTARGGLSRGPGK